MFCFDLMLDRQPKHPQLVLPVTDTVLLLCVRYLQL